MKRKVIKQAGSAYTLTLPIKWVRENDIDEKKEVDVIEDGKSLIVSNLGGTKKKRAKVDMSGFYFKNVFLHLNSLYAVGVDEIEITSEKDISTLLVNALNTLIGYVLVDKDGDKYLIKDIGGNPLSDLDEVFKRVFQAVILFFESAIADIFGEEKEKECDLNLRDKEINKLCLYLQRSINKMSYADAVYGRALFTYSFELERIGDNILRLWRMNIKEGPRKSAELRKLADLCLEMLEYSFDLFYRFDSMEIDRSYEIRRKVRGVAGKIKGDSRLSRYFFEISESVTDLTHLILAMKLPLVE